MKKKKFKDAFLKYFFFFILKNKRSVSVLALGAQVVLGLAVGIKEVTCPPLYPSLQFTGELEKHPTRLLFRCHGLQCDVFI